MTTWAIVPVKPLSRAKSRLARVLSNSERQGLSREFLEHTLATLAQVHQIQRTLVISRDTEALTIARERGAHTVTESGAPELNLALTRATQVAAAFGARGVLVIPTDLPLLTAADVEQLLLLGDDEPVAVIAPDRHGNGTNALLVRPPQMFKYAFGPGSCQKHLERARAAGARALVCRLPGTGLDVDEPDDLRLYQETVINHSGG
ncbi:MAG: 2-phospho-L-lactate guanylyltransferase [Chloroflexi bacterium]|nr:2-phospho-L-lactate guanylyltransferase [Chloroflexota bacterium]